MPLQACSGGPQTCRAMGCAVTAQQPPGTQCQGCACEAKDARTRAAAADPQPSCGGVQAALFDIFIYCIYSSMCWGSAQVAGLAVNMGVACACWRLMWTMTAVVARTKLPCAAELQGDERLSGSEPAGGGTRCVAASLTWRVEHVTQTLHCRPCCTVTHVNLGSQAPW